MKILVVNDDSIYAPGIELLAKEASKFGEVYVVAPDKQNSAMSQRLSLSTTLHINKANNFPAPVMGAYKVSGTPVDCVKVAIQCILKEKPDYVFSGINDGYNSGYDISYSGTIGATFEALRFGVPAIAFSSTYKAPLKIAEKHLEPIIKELLKAGQKENEVWNVNFPQVPENELKGILRDRKVAPVQFFTQGYTEKVLSDEEFEFTGFETPVTLEDNIPEGTDIEAVLNGYISIGKVKYIL